jgi:hypothetical protein
MVETLKIAGKGIWFVAMLCMYLMTCNAFTNISTQEDTKVVKPISSFKILPAFASNDAISNAGSSSNNSANNETSFPNSTFFLKYNNLGNSHNKAGSNSYNIPGYPNSGPSHQQFIPSTPTSSYYNPAYSYYPGSFGLYPYQQATPPPSYFSYPQTSAQFTPSFSLGSSTYPWAVSSTAGVPAPQHYLSSPIPSPLFSPLPPPLSWPQMHSTEIANEHSLKSDDPARRNESKMVSPWFPSIPASDCEGVFEFTVEGTTHLQAEDLKDGNHKVTIKMTSASPGSLDGELWVDRKTNNDKGSRFEIDKTFNNCRVVTASSVPQSVDQLESSSTSLLQSLLNDLPDDHYSSDEDSTYETDDNIYDQQKEDNEEADNNQISQREEADQEDVEGERKVEIAALE